MIELDIILISAALGLSIFTKRREAVLLCMMFFGSTGAASLGLTAFLGAMWYPFLCIYLLAFCALSKSPGVMIGYACMIVLCIFSIGEFPSNQTVIYNSYAYIMATIFLVQLGCTANGHCNDLWLDISRDLPLGGTKAHTKGIV